MQDLNVTLIQSPLHWEDIGANLAMFEEKLWQIKDQTDLIILPEMFTTGFSMNAESLAEPMNLTTLKWLKQQAAQKDAVIMGSYIVKENGNYFNRLVAMKPGGDYFKYDKRHPFSMAEEDKTYSAGNNRLVFELKGWKICPMVCYDLRFPVWSRNRHQDGQLEYDLLVYVANWPAPRVNAWDTLLQARGIENLSYCAGVNRIGKDRKGLDYLGHSAVYNFKGQTMFFNEGDDIIQTVNLNYQDLKDFREKVGFHLDSDDFEIK